MKKIVVLLLFVSLFSCSVSDNTPRSYDAFLPVESVSMPDQFITNQTHIIYLTYYKPTSCHLFKDVYYTANGNQSTIAIVSEFYPDSSDCQEIITEAETSFNFRPSEIGTYVFKFWQGENTVNGISEDTYLVYEIDVVE